MGLKAFHIFFIAVCTLLALVMAVFAAMEMTGLNRILWITGSIVSGVGLVVYGVRFLRKMKDVSYF